MRQVQRASRAKPSLSQSAAGYSNTPHQEAGDWEKRLSVGDFAGVIRDYVEAYAPVTFREIAQLLRNHLPTAGECGLQVGDDQNCVLYGDLSPELAELLHGMLGEGIVVARPCASWYYDAADSLRRLPLVSDVPTQQLDRPHWLPCTLHITVPATIKPVLRPAEVN